MLDFYEFCPYIYDMRKITKPRMGRPPKSGDKAMGQRLEIRLLPGEKDAYEKAADVAGIDRSEWIRLTLNDAAQRALRRRRTPVQ